MKSDSIIKSTIILTLAGFGTRVLGFIYRVYMSKELGAEEMGLYQLILPIYFMAWSITCSGISTTISKLTSEETGKKNYANIKQYLFQSLLITFIISVSLSIITYYLSEYIALTFYNEHRVIEPIKILSLSFPFMALGSCIRGYFYGLQKSSIPASSQILEQIFKILVVFILVIYFGSLNIIYAVLGITISEFVSFLYVIYEYKKNKFNYSSLNHKKSISFTNSLIIILSMSLPLTANRVLTSSLVTYENILIPFKLQQFGMNKSEALALFGQLNGMALPLIYFPSSLLVAISISLVPAISKAKAQKNEHIVLNSVKNTLRFTSFTSFWAMGFFVIFSNHLGLLIYEQNISLFIKYFGFLAPFLYMQMILSGILSGFGKHITLFINNIFGSIITIISIYILVPSIGIEGFIIGLFFNMFYVCYFNYNKIKKYSKIDLSIFKLTVKPFLSSTLSILITRLLLNNFQVFAKINLFSLILGSFCLSIIYLFFVLGTGFIKIKDILKVINYIKTPVSNLNKNLFS